MNLQPNRSSLSQLSHDANRLRTAVLERIGIEIDLLDNGACDVLDKLSNAGAAKLLDQPVLSRTQVFVAIRVGVEIRLDLHMKRERSERRGSHGRHGKELDFDFLEA